MMTRMQLVDGSPFRDRPLAAGASGQQAGFSELAVKSVFGKDCRPGLVLAVALPGQVLAYDKLFRE